MSEDTLEETGIGFDLRDGVAILIRWRYWLVGGLLLGTLAATLYAFIVQPVYRSAASLLIESQDIPTTIVASPLNDMAEDRIGKVREQVLSRQNLQQLIERNKLYPKQRRTLSPDGVIALLRRDIAVDLVGATQGNATQNGKNSTIAFTLSYSSADPTAALNVTNQLTDMFVSENDRLRSQQARGAALFLVRRADELRDRLVELEAKRRSIQGRYNGALPDQIALSQQSTSSLRAEISRLDAETQGIAQQNSLLAVRGQQTAAPLPSPARAELAQAEARYDRMRAIYSDAHPDVIAAQEALGLARQAVAREPAPSDPNVPLRAEVAAGNTRIAALSQRRAALVGAIGQADRLVALAPEATYELNNVEREYDNLKQQYQTIREKQLDAQVAVNLQAEGKGERFTVVDRPSYPVEPISPHRLQLIMLGAAAGIAAPVAFMFLWELTNRPIHGIAALRAATGMEPLCAIMTMRPQRDGDAASWAETLRERFAVPWRRHASS